MDSYPDAVVWAVNLNGHNFGLVSLEALQKKLGGSSGIKGGASLHAKSSLNWADDIVAGNEALPPPEGGAD